MSELEFSRDTALRKQFFTPESFRHPAKMNINLLLWIVDKFTQPSETILDPMFGIGTTMLACTLDRNVIGVELEQKFVDMAVANWEKVKAMPRFDAKMGTCQIIQGDVRNLEGLLADKIITSPPYEESMGEKHHSPAADKIFNDKGLGVYTDRVDKIITSPPYAGAQSGGGIAQEGYTKPYQKGKIGGDNLDPVGRRSYMPENVGDNPENIQRLPYGKVDNIISSPPYGEADQHNNSERGVLRKNRPDLKAWLYSKEQAGDNLFNIGNLKSQSYLDAMLQVYQQCHCVLKPDGLMILVTKNFIREKQEIRLDNDTITLCEKVGFTFQERHYRKLMAQSFWRIIYKRRYPSAPTIDSEDILVFRK